MELSILKFYLHTLRIFRFEDLQRIFTSLSQSILSRLERPLKSREGEEERRQSEIDRLRKEACDRLNLRVSPLTLVCSVTETHHTKTQGIRNTTHTETGLGINLMLSRVQEKINWYYY